MHSLNNKNQLKSICDLCLPQFNFNKNRWEQKRNRRKILVLFLVVFLLSTIHMSFRPNYICFSFYRKIPDGRYVDVRKPKTFSSFRPHEETVFILHGFNGTARDTHMRYLKDGKTDSVPSTFHQSQNNMWKKSFDSPFRSLSLFTAYLSRNFNVVLVDWKKLTHYPCYFSALGNTKLVAQCTAQVKIENQFLLQWSHWSLQFNSRVNVSWLVYSETQNGTNWTLRHHKCRWLEQSTNHK